MAELRRLNRIESQRELPAARDWRRERDAAIENKVAHVGQTWDLGLSGEAFFLAKILVICGLPIRETKEREIFRKARVSKTETVTVRFAATGQGVSLPFGHDRLMAHFLTTGVNQTQNTLLNWTDINAYLKAFGQFEKGGRQHRDAQARFIRLAFLDISMDIHDAATDTTRHIKAPIIDAARLTGGYDEGKGQWDPGLTPAKWLARNQDVLRVGDNFAEYFLSPGHAIPVPVELVRLFAKTPRHLDLATWIYWRTYAALSRTVIRWDQITPQFEALSSVREWRRQFREVMSLFAKLPDPLCRIEVGIHERGLEIIPVPAGVSYFKNHPKLGFKPSSVGE